MGLKIGESREDWRGVAIEDAILQTFRVWTGGSPVVLAPKGGTTGATSMSTGSVGHGICDRKKTSMTTSREASETSGDVVCPTESSQSISFLRPTWGSAA